MISLAKNKLWWVLNPLLKYFYSRLNLYNKPCIEGYNKCRTYRAHAGYVGRVAFTEEGDRLFTVGGYDKTIIQWKRLGI